MDIADHVVNVVLIDNNLADTVFNERVLQFLNRRLDVYGNDFRSRNQAVPYLDVREIQCILEDLDFRINLFFVLGFVNTALDEIVGSILVKALLLASLFGRVPVRRRKPMDRSEEKRLTG